MARYKLSDYARKKGVSYRTVWNWIRRGEIRTETSHTGRHFVVEDPIADKKVAVYARVSSSENRDNLERQAERLVQYANAKGYAVSKIVKEVGSGLNDERKQLMTLLGDPSINVIIVEHKDRLTRFGFNYIQSLLNLSERTIEVVNPPGNEKEDLMSDFVALVTSFSDRLYGLRRSKRQTEKLIHELSQ